MRKIDLSVLWVQSLECCFQIIGFEFKLLREHLFTTSVLETYLKDLQLWLLDLRDAY